MLLVALVGASVAASGRIAYVGFGAHDAMALAHEQVRWLQPQLSGDSPARSDADVRDGEVLYVAFTALAAARDEKLPTTERLGLVRAGLARLDASDVRGRYASRAQPSPGAFLQGWSLLVAVELARLSDEAADRDAVRVRGAPLVAALGTVTSGVLPSYGETYRPVDTVVVAAALRKADEIAAMPGAAAAIEAWLPRLNPLRDPATQLLPHRTDAAGRPLDGARATSQAMIQAFWPSIDRAGATSSRDWVAFENTFLCPRLGLATVCEYPGGGGSGDSLSGPLIAGVSPAATVITLAAARAHGNQDLADEISREAELFGAPVADERGRRYLSGSAPAGDALLAWARTIPVERELPGVDDRDPVAWPAWTLGVLIPAVLAMGGLAWRFLARRRFSGPLEADAAPPDAPYGPGRAGTTPRGVDGARGRSPQTPTYPSGDP